MQVWFKYSASLYEGERWRRGGGKEEEAREKQELGTSAGQTRQKTTGGWRCCLWPLIQGRIKQRRRGRTEEPGSLVGWRWRGSPTAVDTQAQRRDWISAVAPCWQVYSPHVYIHAQTHRNTVSSSNTWRQSKNTTNVTKIWSSVKWRRCSCTSSCCLSTVTCSLFSCSSATGEQIHW